MLKNLSSKKIPVDERLIFALDSHNHSTAKRLVAHLKDEVFVYRIGAELCMSGGCLELVEWLRRQGKLVFCDLKFFDTPETVARAVHQLAKHGVDFASVQGNDALLDAAAQEKGKLKLLAVTAPTSLDRAVANSPDATLSLGDLTLARAKSALQLGFDGVFSSGLEAEGLRDDLGDRLLIVYPDLALIDQRPGDKQQRAMPIEQAFQSGADYVVLGRQIKNAQDPRVAAEEIQERIEELFQKQRRTFKAHIT